MKRALIKTTPVAGDGSSGSQAGAAAAVVAAPAPMSSAPPKKTNPFCLQLPAFLLQVKPPGEFGQMGRLLLASPEVGYDPTTSKAPEVKAVDAVVPQITGPLYTFDEATKALKLHFARYSTKDDQKNSFMWSLKQPFPFREGDLLDVDFSMPNDTPPPLGPFVARPYGSALVGNVSLKPDSYIDQREGLTKGQPRHKLAVHATHLQLRGTTSVAHSLEAEFDAWASSALRTLPPLFPSTGREGVTDDFLARQRQRLDAFLVKCTAEAVTQHWNKQPPALDPATGLPVATPGGKKKKAFDPALVNTGPVEVPPPTRVLFILNREHTAEMRREMTAQAALDRRRFVMPEASFTDMTAQATLTLGTIDRPLYDELLSWKTDKGVSRLELQMPLLLAGMQVPPPAPGVRRRAGLAADFEQEFFSIGFASTDGNPIYSNMFARFGQPLPFLVAPLLANPTPAFGGVPLHAIVRVRAQESLQHQRNTPMDAAARADNYPNGHHSPLPEEFIPCLNGYLAYKAIPVSAELVQARYKTFTASDLVSGRSLDAWALDAYGIGKGDKRHMTGAYQPTTFAANPGFVWLDTLSGNVAKALSKEMLANPAARDQWRFFAVPAYKLEGDECPAFANDPAVEPLLAYPEYQCPRRHGLRTPAQGDAFVRKAVAAAYARRAIGKDPAIAAEAATNPPIDDAAASLWTEADLWMQDETRPLVRRPGDAAEGHPYTMPAFIFFAVKVTDLPVFPDTPPVIPMDVVVAQAPTPALAPTPVASPAAEDAAPLDEEPVEEPPHKKPRLEEKKEEEEDQGELDPDFSD